MTGGTTAKLMVGAMKNDWGKKLYEGTLTRNIAGVIYKVKYIYIHFCHGVECNFSGSLSGTLFHDKVSAFYRLLWQVQYFVGHM